MCDYVLNVVLKRSYEVTSGHVTCCRSDNISEVVQDSYILTTDHQSTSSDVWPVRYCRLR